MLASGAGPRSHPHTGRDRVRRPDVRPRAGRGRGQIRCNPDHLQRWPSL